MITVNKMRQHVERLVTEMRETIVARPSSLQLHWIENRNEAIAIADDDTIQLRIPFVLTPEDYGTCLYSLARVYDAEQSSANIDEVTRERALWIWAREAALVWTPEMELDAQVSLQGHLDHFRDSAAAEQPLIAESKTMDKGIPVKLAPLKSWNF